MTDYRRERQSYVRSAGGITGRRIRRRPMLRWEDCVKRDARKTGERKKKTRDR